jgi:hypothetical protein
MPGELSSAAREAMLGAAMQTLNQGSSLGNAEDMQREITALFDRGQVSTDGITPCMCMIFHAGLHAYGRRQ